MAAPLDGALGPYRLDDSLGRGGMGEVYRAYDERLDRAVAIKVIRPDVMGRGGARAERIRRFRREARAAAGLDHPAIVQVHDILETPRGDAIVMELVHGMDLARRRRERPLSVQQVIDVLRQVAAGLAAAHRKGLVHRDLKAENVMLRPDGRAKILDFGIAAPEREQGEGGPVGTYRAMSPEQARGLAVDPRSDLFSLGVLAYELLADHSPFLAESPRETLSNVCVQRQVPLDERVTGLPAGLSRLVDGLLEKNPARRPAGAEVVMAELELIEDGLDRRAPSSQPDPELDPQLAPSRAAALGSGTTPVDIGGTTRLSSLPEARPRRPLGPGIGFASLALVVVLGLAWAESRRTATTRGAHGSGSQGGVAASDVASQEIGVERAPLYVAVAAPHVEAGEVSEDIDLKAATVRVALQRALVSLVGVAPLATEALDALPGPPVQQARALGVAELVTAGIGCLPDVCDLAVRRVRPADGSVIWEGELRIPADELGLLARAVEDHLRQAFTEHRRRPDFPELEVEGADYEEYHHLRIAFRERRLSAVDLLDKLGTLRRRSPAFLEALLFEAFVLRERFLTEHRADDLEAAVELLESARAKVPSDPRPLATLFEVQLAASRPEEAERTLEELEELAPASPAALVGRARLQELRGEPVLALEAMRRAVRHQPARPWLHRLAEMELRAGDTAAARRTLDSWLERFPDDEPGLALLAQLELLAGSVERSAELFERLTAERQDFARLTNLGVARLLLGQPEQAVHSFRAALDGAPENAFAQLNLADALRLTGEQRAARRLYEKVIETLAPAPPTAWQTQTVRAQALAHLGRRDEALEAASTGLELAPNHPQAVLEASLVRALLGDRDQALRLARRALELGVEPRWLELPGFDEVRPLLSEPS